LFRNTYKVQESGEKNEKENDLDRGSRGGADERISEFECKLFDSFTAGCPEHCDSAEHK
jgi:hypothetical protein